MLSLTALLPFRSPLLWESRLISLPLGTEMFHFPRFASTEVDNIHRYMLGCPIQKPPDQSSLAAPRGISSPNTSFIASTSQGIHLWPLISFLLLDITQSEQSPDYYANAWFSSAESSLHQCNLIPISKTSHQTYILIYVSLPYLMYLYLNKIIESVIVVIQLI